MDAPSHDVVLLPMSGGPARPTDAEACGWALDDDCYLRGATTVAGALLAWALTAVLITSLIGASTVAWTVLLAVAAAGLIVVKTTPVVHPLGDQRVPTDRDERAVAAGPPSRAHR